MRVATPEVRKRADKADAARLRRDFRLEPTGRLRRIASGVATDRRTQAAKAELQRRGET